MFIRFICALSIFIGSLTSNSFAQPSFQFCGFVYEEPAGISGLLEQAKELPVCIPGSGSIWRVRYDPEITDPSHLAALFCDFSKQILISDTNIYGESNVTCVVRSKPEFSY